MQVTKAQLGLEIDISSKEELISTVTKLLMDDITNFIINEKVKALGSSQGYSSLSDGYVVTVFTKNISEVKLLNQLLDEN